MVQARGAVRAVRKGAEGKPRIRAVGEIAGFGGLRAADAAELRALVEAELAFRAGLQAAEADGAEIFDHPEGKFWSIVCAGSTTRVKWGRAGEEGQLSEKSHADEEAAGKFVEKMVRRGGRRARLCGRSNARARESPFALPAVVWCSRACGRSSAGGTACVERRRFGPLIRLERRRCRCRCRRQIKEKTKGGYVRRPPAAGGGKAGPGAAPPPDGGGGKKGGKKREAAGPDAAAAAEAAAAVKAEPAAKKAARGGRGKG